MIICLTFLRSLTIWNVHRFGKFVIGNSLKGLLFYCEMWDEILCLTETYCFILDWNLRRIGNWHQRHCQPAKTSIFSWKFYKFWLSNNCAKSPWQQGKLKMTHRGLQKFQFWKLIKFTTLHILLQHFENKWQEKQLTNVFTSFLHYEEQSYSS